MKKGLLFAALLTCGNIDAITWEEALIAAYNNNNAWFAEQIDKEIADANYTQSVLTFLPNVNGSIGSTRSKTEEDDDRFVERVHSRKTSTNFRVTVQQNLFNGFSTINTVRASDNNSKAAFHKLKHNEQTLIVNVLDAYTSVWVGREKVKALRQKEINLKKTLESQEAALETGMSTQSEVALAQANHEKATYERINAETELFTAESNFEKLTGMKADEKMDLPSIDFPLPDSLKKLISVAMKSNHSIMYYKYNEMAANNRLDATRGKLAPSCDLSLQAGRGLDKTSNRFQSGDWSDPRNPSRNNYSASLSVTVPIFANSSSGNTYSAISIANKEALKAQFTAKDAVAEVKKECVVNWNTYISANAMIDASRSAVKSAELSSESRTEENDMGLKPSTDVWVQENQLLEARVSLATSLKQKVMAKVKLYALTGDLSLQSILKKK